MTFFSVEHTFIICCGNKCSFIDYKIKVSSLGIFLFECVCLSIGWLFGCCERWLLFGLSDGDSLLRFDTLSYARIFLFVFFFLSCVFSLMYFFQLLSGDDSKSAPQSIRTKLTGCDSSPNAVLTFTLSRTSLDVRCILCVSLCMCVYACTRFATLTDCSFKTIAAMYPIVPKTSAGRSEMALSLPLIQLVNLILSFKQNMKKKTTPYISYA